MKSLTSVLILCCFISFGAASPAPVTLANPLQGTDSLHSYSHGNTYPAIAVPFPMNAWAPYTQPQRDSFFYQYRRTKSAASARRISPARGSPTTRTFR
jgi:putative alpha-1,2-mannosidase